MDELLAEMHHVLEATPAGHVRDVLSIGYVQNINMYKITTYRSAYKLSIELELDTATDLLQQILSWEEKTCHALALLAAEIFSQSNQTELKS